YVSAEKPGKYGRFENYMRQIGACKHVRTLAKNAEKSRYFGGTGLLKTVTTGLPSRLPCKCPACCASLRRPRREGMKWQNPGRRGGSMRPERNTAAWRAGLPFHASRLVGRGQPSTDDRLALVLDELPALGVLEHVVLGSAPGFHPGEDRQPEDRGRERP